MMEEVNILSANAHRFDLASPGLVKVTPLKIAGEKLMKTPSTSFT